MIFAIFNQAGGAGKSTIALNLAFTLIEQGMKDVVIVTNEQAHGLDNVLPKRHFVILPERAASIPEQLFSVPKKSVVIYDFAGKTDARIKQVAEMADRVIIPTKGESTNKIEQFTRTVRDLEAFTSKITICLTAFNKNSKNSRLFDAAGDYLMKYPTYPIKQSESFNLIWDEKRSVNAQFKDGGLNGRNYREANRNFNELIKHIFDGGKN